MSLRCAVREPVRGTAGYHLEQIFVRQYLLSCLICQLEQFGSEGTVQTDVEKGEGFTGKLLGSACVFVGCRVRIL